MSGTKQNEKIEVLLATYNGESYLSRQIGSIFSQDHSEVGVLARDDGSNDATAAILAETATHHPERFQLLPTGVPTGSATGNFVTLLRKSTADYIAFSDQDDVWLPHKLSASFAAMRSLEATFGTAVPLLVFSDLMVVDNHLNVISKSLWQHNSIKPVSVKHIARLVSENVVTGCTMLINRAMADAACLMPLSITQGEHGVMHDHWIGMIAATLGQAAWLETPTVLYRQHENNQVGAAREDRSYAGRYRRIFGRQAYETRKLTPSRLQEQARLFLQTYESSLSEKDRNILRIYIRLNEETRWARLQHMIRYGFWRGTVARNITTLLDIFRS